jgi:glycosyltransferase involved in cell wall biosynthesis
MKHSGVEYLELPLVRLRYTVNPATHLRFLALFWPNVCAIRSVIRDRGIQVVHTNSLRHLQAAIAARLEGVPLVWHLNDTGTPLMLRWLILPALRRWAHVIAVSAAALVPYYFRRPKEIQERLHVLYAPVDPDRFDDPAARRAIRGELGIPMDCPLISMIGNLMPGKGIEHLLGAAPAIRRQHPAARFVIVGGMANNRPRYRESLLKRRAELGLDRDFLFVGHRNDVARILLASDVYVHPSESEACPLAVLEAGASGRPVVATRVGGTAELIEDRVTGILIDPKAPAQIAEAVLALLGDPATARLLGERGAARIRRLFSLDVCAESHIKVYRAAVARAAKRTLRVEEAQRGPISVDVPNRPSSSDPSIEEICQNK